MQPVEEETHGNLILQSKTKVPLDRFIPESLTQWIKVLNLPPK